MGEADRLFDGSDAHLFISFDAMAKTFEYIINQAQNCPNDSLRDIANEAFEQNGIPFSCEEDLSVKIDE